MNGTTKTASGLVGMLVVLLLWVLAAPLAAWDRTNANGNQLIVRAAQQDMAAIAEQYGLTILSENGRGGYAALVRGAAGMTAGQLTSLMAGDSRIQELNPATVAALPTDSNILLAVEEANTDKLKVGDFSTPCLSEGFGGLVWSGYGDQEMSQKIRLHEAHTAGFCGGAVTIAVIDTGVDPDHPMLASALVGGYDFLTGNFKASEWESLDNNGSATAIVEEKLKKAGSATAIVENESVDVNGSATAIVEGDIVSLAGGSSFGPILTEEVVTSLEGELVPAAFGHGTMVAGLLRLVAPNASIMPLRVFDGNGTAHVFDVVRAIYLAVDAGADVINMSFSMNAADPEMLRAIKYATSQGVVCVAAAGNQGQHAVVYPAAFGDTVAVTSLTDNDTLSDFSNYGTGLVDLAAPGHGLISTFPGGLFGAGWGTSFSTPLAAGTAALMLPSYNTRDAAMANALMNDLKAGAERISGLESDIGRGRLDVLGAVEASQ